MADTKVSAMTENTDPQPGDLLYLSDGGAADRKIELATLGHLTYTTEAPTTGDVTGVVGMLHDVDISGITAQRNFLLPTTAGIGDRVGVRISTTHATQGRELGIRTGAASDTINGTDYSAADFTKIWQVSEYMEFMCIVADTAWIVVNDGRIPCVVNMTMTTQQTDLADNSADLVDFDTAGLDQGGCADTSNNQIVVRRAATGWAHDAALQMNEALVTSGTLVLEIRDNAGASSYLREGKQAVTTSSGNMASVSGVIANVSDGDIFEVWATIDVTTGPGTVSTLNERTRWSATEIL